MVSLARYDISYQLNEIEVSSSYGRLATSHAVHITVVMEHVNAWFPGSPYTPVTSSSGRGISTHHVQKHLQDTVH